jgi:hypothetical protein
LHVECPHRNHMLHLAADGMPPAEHQCKLSVASCGQQAVAMLSCGCHVLSAQCPQLLHAASILCAGGPFINCETKIHACIAQHMVHSNQVPSSHWWAAFHHAVAGPGHYTLPLSPGGPAFTIPGSSRHEPAVAAPDSPGPADYSPAACHASDGPAFTMAARCTPAAPAEVLPGPGKRVFSWVAYMTSN